MTNYKDEVTETSGRYTFRGYALSQDFKTISKDDKVVSNSECLRYGDKIAWFIAEVIL